MTCSLYQPRRGLIPLVLVISTMVPVVCTMVLIMCIMVPVMCTMVYSGDLHFYHGLKELGAWRHRCFINMSCLELPFTKTSLINEYNVT